MTTAPPSEIAETLMAVATSSLRANVEFIVTFSFPSVLYGCFAPTSRVARASWLASAIVCIATLQVLNASFVSDLVGACAAFMYYLAAAAAVFQLHEPVAKGRIGKDSLFCIALLAYVALPTLIFRSTGLIAALVIGWFLVLSSYSYCVDIGRQRYAASFRDFLFFTFIDPALSLPERSTRAAARIEWRNVASRAFVSMLLVTLGQSLLTLLPMVADAARLERAVGTYGATMIRGIGVFVAIYWLRSGLASVRIAMLESFGFDVPAAYDRPYLAASPREFWSRWNLYVGRWARRYIFGPVALHIARHTKSAALAKLQLARVIAVFATFLAIGALHDTLNFAGQGTTELVYLKVFALAAFVLLSWEGVRLVAQWIQRMTAMRVPPFVIALAGHFGVLHYVVMLMVILRRI